MAAKVYTKVPVHFSARVYGKLMDPQLHLGGVSIPFTAEPIRLPWFKGTSH